MATIATPTGNRLLDSLSPADFALLEPFLKAVSLSSKDIMEKADTPVLAAWFPLNGIISVVTKSGGGRHIEVGLIGREGMSGISVVMGNAQSPNDSYVQVEGSAFRLETGELRRAMSQSFTLRDKLMRYAQALMFQTTQTAMANGSAKIGERLARWLLMAQDRMQRVDLPLTHEFLSIMLGVRRPGVTEALNAMEGRGLIKATRGAVRIIDRPGIVAWANGCYGIVEAEYERLML